MSAPHPEIRRLQAQLTSEPSAIDAMAELQARALNTADRRLAFQLSRWALVADRWSHIPYVMLARVFSVTHFSIRSYFSAVDTACRRALVLNPGSDEAWFEQIKTYRGYHSESLIRWLARLRCITPNNPNVALMSIATLFDVGEVEAGRTVARDALQTQNDILEIALHLSLNFAPGDASLLNAVATAVEKNSSMSLDQRAKGTLIAARLAHQAGDIPKAFQALSQSIVHGRLVHGNRVNADGLRQILIQQSADAMTLEITPRAGNRVGMVMVSGLPRSGTTLMESRLARHADVRALGETYLVEASYTILRSNLVQRRAATRQMASVLLGQDNRPPPGRTEIRWFSEMMPMIVAYDGVARSLLDEVRTIIVVRPFLSTWISGNLMGLGAKHPYFLDPHQLYRIYDLHLDLAEDLFSRVDASKAIMVTLEGLSEDPDGVAEAVQARLDLPKREGPDDPNGTGIVRTLSQGRVRDTVSRAVSDQYLPYRGLLDPETLAVVERADTRRARFLDAFQERLIGTRD